MTSFDTQIFTKTSSVESIVPRGLSRSQAAHYVGIGTTFFDLLVAEGKMPKPIRLGNRKLWDRHELDMAFDALHDQPSDPSPNPWNA